MIEIRQSARLSGIDLACTYLGSRGLRLSLFSGRLGLLRGRLGFLVGISGSSRFIFSGSFLGNVHDASTINKECNGLKRYVDQRVFASTISYTHTLDAGAFLGAALAFGSGAGLAGCEATRDERRGSAADASVSFFLGGIVGRRIVGNMNV